MSRERRELSGPEGLRVYWLALDFAAEVDVIIRTTSVRKSLEDQLARASESIILNIAEGAAHFSPGKKIVHYQLARGSAGECLSALTKLNRDAPTPAIKHAIRTANMICTMLTSLILSQEKRRGD